MRGVPPNKLPAAVVSLVHHVFSSLYVVFSLSFPLVIDEILLLTIGLNVVYPGCAISVVRAAPVVTFCGEVGGVGSNHDLTREAVLLADQLLQSVLHE